MALLPLGRPSWWGGRSVEEIRRWPVSEWMGGGESKQALALVVVGFERTEGEGETSRKAHSGRRDRSRHGTAVNERSGRTGEVRESCLNRVE